MLQKHQKAINISHFLYKQIYENSALHHNYTNNFIMMFARIKANPFYLQKLIANNYSLTNLIKGTRN